MSMQRACIVIETEPNKWFCITAVDEYDEEFRHYVVNGSFSSADRAFESHDGCNPGGYSTIDNQRFNQLSAITKNEYLKMIKKREG